MAKRVFKDQKIRQIVKNISDDFRFSSEMDSYALLFYKAESEGQVSGGDIEKMLEYVTTGLKELENNIEWRQQFMNENTGFEEIKMLENLRTIEEEYVALKAFLEK